MSASRESFIGQPDFLEHQNLIAMLEISEMALTHSQVGFEEIPDRRFREQAIDPLEENRLGLRNRRQDILSPLLR